MIVSVAVAGLLFGLSLIVIIGPQNVFVIRVGVLGRGVGLVVAVCTLADAALIAAGVAGAGAVVRSAGWVLTAARYAGAAFLLGYAVLAARRAVRPPDRVNPPPESGTGLTRSRNLLATTLALTFLNPGVYLDTVVLLGAVAATHHPQQWWFGLGAALGSALWFAGLGYGARRLGRLVDRPSTWRWLDAFVAVVMTATAVRLLLGS